MEGVTGASRQPRRRFTSTERLLTRMNREKRVGATLYPGRLSPALPRPRPPAQPQGQGWRCAPTHGGPSCTPGPAGLRVLRGLRPQTADRPGQTAPLFWKVRNAVCALAQTARPRWQQGVRMESLLLFFCLSFSGRSSAAAPTRVQ